VRASGQKSHDTAPQPGRATSHIPSLVVVTRRAQGKKRTDGGWEPSAEHQRCPADPRVNVEDAW